MLQERRQFSEDATEGKSAMYISEREREDGWILKKHLPHPTTLTRIMC
jgi:hypothetical protein